LWIERKALPKQSLGGLRVAALYRANSQEVVGGKLARFLLDNPFCGGTTLGEIPRVNLPECFIV
jgi:hypothetical protein